MPAWKHFGKWNAAVYSDYRKYVEANAPRYRGRQEDCADLSLELLIDFAAANGLPVTFEDVDGWRYISKADTAFGPIARYLRTDKMGPTGPAIETAAKSMVFPWLTKEAFTVIVQQYIQTKSLWKHNTVVNGHGPEPGDLMMAYTTSVGGVTDRHHTALVYRFYPPGASHPKWNDLSVPSFPGPDAAMDDFNQTEYFKGTVFPGGQVTIQRFADTFAHFDYLNSRGERKRNAELIYFANAWQAVHQDGFEFRMYGPQVLDNWSDWDGKGTPPR